MKYLVQLINENKEELYPKTLNLVKEFILKTDQSNFTIDGLDFNKDGEIWEIEAYFINTRNHAVDNRMRLNNNSTKGYNMVQTVGYGDVTSISNVTTASAGVIGETGFRLGVAGANKSCVSKITLRRGGIVDYNNGVNITCLGGMADYGYVNQSYITGYIHGFSENITSLTFFGTTFRAGSRIKIYRK